MFFAQMMGAVLFDNKILYETARTMFRHFDLGELGETARSKFSPNYLTNCSDPYIAIALVDIYLLTKNEEYMILAECVIDKMIRTHWYYPYFKPNLANRFASIDSREIYAAVYFLSVSKGKIPEPYFSSYSFIYGNYLFPSGEVKDNRDILILFNTI